MSFLGAVLRGHMEAPPEDQYVSCAEARLVAFLLLPHMRKEEQLYDWVTLSSTCRLLRRALYSQEVFASAVQRTRYPVQLNQIFQIPHPPPLPAAQLRTFQRKRLSEMLLPLPLQVQEVHDLACSFSMPPGGSLWKLCTRDWELRVLVQVGISLLRENAPPSVTFPHVVGSHSLYALQVSFTYLYMQNLLFAAADGEAPRLESAHAAVSLFDQGDEIHGGGEPSSVV